MMVRGLVAACALAGCGASEAAADAPEVPAVARARQWVAAKLRYCQAINHARDNDPECPATCDRAEHPEWDAYRSDCSGLVSWAWELPSAHGGLTTADLAPFRQDASHAIAARELAPGDAINNAHHVMLFAGWIVAGVRARFIEEPGCSSPTPYAHELDANVVLVDDLVVVADAGVFTAIRRDQ
jgi:hypothetical protein